MFPACFRAFAMGSSGALPMPPPTQATMPKFSICVGLPNGPATFAISSPSFRSANSAVVLPTRCQISLIVPFSASASAIVRGIRSAYSLFRLIMTNWPGFLARATRAASISAVKTFSESCSLDKILCDTITPNEFVVDDFRFVILMHQSSIVNRLCRVYCVGEL